MATKKEILEAATALTTQHKTPASFNEALFALLEVKSGGGMSFKIEDVAVLDGEGQPVFILDSKLNKWVPVTDVDGNDLFYVKPDTTLGYSRWAKASESSAKKADKTFKATKDAIFKDLMSGDIDQTAAQKLMEQAETAKIKESIPTAIVSYSDKPELKFLVEAHKEQAAIDSKLAADKAAAAEQTEDAAEAA